MGQERDRIIDEKSKMNKRKDEQIKELKLKLQEAADDFEKLQSETIIKIKQKIKNANDEWAATNEARKPQNLEKLLESE